MDRVMNHIECMMNPIDWVMNPIDWVMNPMNALSEDGTCAG